MFPKKSNKWLYLSFNIYFYQIGPFPIDHQSLYKFYLYNFFVSIITSVENSTIFVYTLYRLLQLFIIYKRYDKLLTLNIIKLNYLNNFFICRIIVFVLLDTDLFCIWASKKTYSKYLHSSIRYLFINLSLKVAESNIIIKMLFLTSEYVTICTDFHRKIKFYSMLL